MTSFTAAYAVKAFYTQYIDGKQVVCIDGNHEYAGVLVAMVNQAIEDLGWDFAHEAVQDCILYLAETDESPEDYDPERANHIPYYNGERVRWLAESPSKHLALCDEWIDKGGADCWDALSERIAGGIRVAYYKAMAAIQRHWPEGDNDDDLDA